MIQVVRHGRSLIKSARASQFVSIWEPWMLPRTVGHYVIVGMPMAIDVYEGDACKWVPDAEDVGVAWMMRMTGMNGVDARREMGVY